MIDFAIIAMPRSGTSWAANWLTGHRHICLHDPLPDYTLDDLLQWAYRNPKETGISCTAIWAHPEWVSANIRRWIVIDRPQHEIQASLAEMGLAPMPQDAFDQFRAMPGRRYQFEDLFKPETAAEIQHHLLPHVPFDLDRHRELCKLEINPRFQALHPNPKAVHEWIERVRQAYDEGSKSI